MLLERAAELTRIGAGLTSARAGRPELLMVRGPVGAGRSALLRELPADPDVGVLRAAGSPGEHDLAYGVLRQLVEPERNTGGLRATPGGAPAVEAAAHALLTRLSAAGPVLLAIDDMQDADEPTLAWLTQVSARRHGLRLLVVGAVRDGDVRSGHPLVRELTESADAVLRPAPLSAPAARRMLHESIGATAAAEFLTACHAAAGGNPLILTALAEHVVSTALPPDAEHAGRVGAVCPAPLRDRLLAVIAGQPAPVRSVAAAIAVLGDDADEALLGPLAGADAVEVGTGLRALRELGLVTADGHPRFTHPAGRSAVEFDMPMAERLRAHQAAAELLYRRGHPSEQVARQLMAVPALRLTWSVEVLRAAAASARHRGAPDVAVDYLRRALLDCSGMGPDRAWLLLDLAAAQRDREPADAERLVDQAVPLFDTPRDRAAAALRITPTVLGCARPPVADLFRRVARDLGDPAASDAPARAAALGLEARLRHIGLADPAELDLALARLRALGAVSPLDSAAERQLIAVLLHAAVVTGRLPAAAIAPLGERILQHETLRSAHPQATVALTVLALTAADALGAASRWLSVGADPVGLRLPAAAENRIDALRAYVHLGRGRVVAARTSAERAAHLAVAGSETETLALGALAWAAVEMHDGALAANVADRLERSSPSLSATVDMVRAHSMAQQGRPDEALETLLDCGARLRDAGWRSVALLPWRVHAAVLRHRLGDRSGAATLLDEEHAGALSWGAPASLGRVLRVKGQMEGGPRGLELLREAVAVLRRSANELELARALLALSRTAPDAAEGVAAGREGTALASSCGVPWLAGATVAAHPVTADSALTKTERLVASLVARGLTNQEIAAMLGVSRRAVEKHLTSCYRKLGVSGRAELVESLTGA
ncbi:LuxR C-terminal-related transcriptional regulator [Mangrovihabitans endophyticus]|uniref:HTH luxR-type domain-containing protein n=1 Tax=Mangrovihabitans endophyticus TaxID=1751298 RepID=A0A8J3C8E4_9ACTN|nr:LuxR C-terminal-related transcriptional regulator [Mangrovihabitans endophyticus]GGL19628.1 hypothetical protein GCM10012284_62770 [Mangrovihabitans endophyticus]